MTEPIDQGPGYLEGEADARYTNQDPDFRGPPLGEHAQVEAMLRRAARMKQHMEECVQVNTNREFYAVVRGESFRTLPCVHVKIPPLISFWLHDLALHPDWSLKIRQKAWLSGASRPRASISNGKNVHLSFNMPVRTSLYTKLVDAICDLELAKFTVRGSRMQYEAPTAEKPRIQRPHMRDELELLEMFNARHYERIKDSLAAVAAPLVVVPDNVVDFVERLERRHYNASDALRAVSKFLQK